MQAFFKKLIMLGALALGGTSAAVQPLPVTISEVPQDTSLPLSQRVTVWENRGDFIPPERMVSGQKDAEFQPDFKDFPGPVYIKGELWLRFLIRNDSLTPESVVLESRYPLTDYLSLHQLDAKGVLQSIHRGDRHENPPGSYPFRSPAFAFVVQPGDNVIYLRSESNGPNILALFLWREAAFNGHRWIDTMVLGGLFGFVIALFFYNSFLAISFSSRTYGLYCIFLLSMILLQISMQNIWPYLVSSSAAVWLDNEGYLWLGSCSGASALAVTAAFLSMKKNLPRVLKFFYGMMIFCIVPPIVGFFAGFNAHARALTIGVGIGAVSMVLASLMAIRKGYRPAIYYLIASVSFLAVNILLVLTVLGVYHSLHVMQYGNFVGVVIEGLLMSLAIGDRIHFIRSQADHLIRELNKELQNHLSQVEAQVAERTETIRTILDNVASGFLIVDPAGLVAPGFSQSCHQLLGEILREGQTFTDCLRLSPRIASLWQLAWTQLFDDAMPTDVALAQLPSAILLNGRALRLEAKALRDEQNRIRMVLFTIQDVTELRRRQRESRRNRSLIRILQDLEAFRQFIHNSFEFVSRLKVAADKREQAFLLHTLKGNSRVFGLTSIARFLHELEELPALKPADIQAIERLFLEFLAAHDAILKTAWGNSLPEPKVTRSQLQGLKLLVHRKQDVALKKDIENWIGDVLARPVSLLVQPVIDNCLVMAKRLQKSVHIEMIGSDARIRTRHEEKALEFLVHILRNAIIHGIESDRGAAGKAEQGRIQLEFEETAQSLVISCLDDGQGFDRARWEEKARSLGLSQDRKLKSLSWVELVELVSRGGYSTQKQATLDAGRGVGLEGIIQAVRSLDGHIHLETEAGKGSLLRIELMRSAGAMIDQAAS